MVETSRVIRPMAMVRPTRAEIDLAAARENARSLSAIAGVPLWAVVKADAYGHGAAHLARALAAEDCVCGLAVSLVEEAIELRDRGIKAPVLVMGPSLDGGYAEIAEHNLIAVISQLGDLDALAAVASARGETLGVHLKIESGMNRLGLVVDEVERAARVDGIEIVGLMTHLASADEDDPDDPDSQTRRQLLRFATSSARLRRFATGALQTHVAASSALLKFSASRLDAARPGIGLYGNGACASVAQTSQVMRLVTEVAQVRRVASGESVSYGATWTASRDSQIAVLPLGYADGIPRSASNQADVLIHGARFPLVGRVCMDMVMIDVTDAARPIAAGDEVVLLGGQQGEAIPASEFGAAANLSEYEVTCGISKRVPRLYR